MSLSQPILKKTNWIIRDFLWHGRKDASSGCCLVNWRRICRPLEYGGLGVHDVAAHIQALLCKFAAKVLQPSDIPCFQWFAAQYCNDRMGLGVHSRDTPI